jgi:DNA-binding FrmR family transcriptional regulator
MFASGGTARRGPDDALVQRLHRVEGQLRGIEKMVEDDRFVIDILTQIGAATTALESLGLQILRKHVGHCLSGALASADEADEQDKTAEILRAVHRFAQTR